MTNIILKGCNGRMGRMITELAAGLENINIVAGIDISECSDKGYPVFRSLAECTRAADVLVDFSSHEGTENLLNEAEKKGLALILCATGYSSEELELIMEASKKLAILRSANMSLGINTMVALIQAAAKVLAEAEFDIEIVEKHHNQKLDAPSGTALLLADKINEVLNGEYDYKYDRSQDRMKRPKKEIGISAVRGGSIVGEHEVIFAGTDEVIEIKHTAYSKAIFAKGALAAAGYMKGRPAGMYSMADVIKK